MDTALRAGRHFAPATVEPMAASGDEAAHGPVVDPEASELPDDETGLEPVEAPGMDEAAMPAADKAAMPDVDETGKTGTASAKETAARRAKAARIARATAGVAASLDAEPTIAPTQRLLAVPEVMVEDVPATGTAPAKAPEPEVQPTPAKSEEELSDVEREASVGRSAAMMSVLVIISRITGFLRTWGQAMALGVTVTSSCYTVANNLPNQLYELVMGGMLATAFLPVYLSVRKREGRAGSNRYTSNLLSIVLAAMGILTLVGIVFAAQVVWTQSFGANADFDFDLAVYFFRFFSIEVMLYALSSVVSGVLNAERDYLWSNAAPIFNNIVCTSSFFIYAALVGTNPGLALLILALGNPLGVAVQCVMQLPSLRRHGIRLTPHIDFSDPALKETLSIGIPSLVVTICSFVTVSVQTSSALSVTVSGSSIAYYTRIWYTLPYSVFAIPITTAMFTELSNSVSAGDTAAVSRGVASGTRRISFMLIPFALYLMVFAVPLITLMAAGKFEPDQVTLTADYLVVLAASLPMYGVCTYLQKVCSSLRRMNLYMVAIAVGSILQVAFCLELTPLFGLMMVPLSSLFFFTVVDVVTFASLRRQLGSIGLASVVGSCLRALALGGAGAVVGMGVLFMLGKVMGPIGMSAGAALVQTVLAGVPAVLVTFGLAIALGLEEVSTFRDLATRLVARLRRAG